MKVLLGSLFIAAAAVTGAGQQITGSTSGRAITEVVASSEKIVKGAPFSAEAVNESLQVLADGNRITRSSSNRMFRDAAGRFRREGITSPGAALGAYIELQPTILILDPVNGFKYYMNSDAKTVRKFSLGPHGTVKVATTTSSGR